MNNNQSFLGDVVFCQVPGRKNTGHAWRNLRMGLQVTKPPAPRKEQD